MNKSRERPAFCRLQVLLQKAQNFAQPDRTVRSLDAAGPARVQNAPFRGAWASTRLAPVKFPQAARRSMPGTSGGPSGQQRGCSQNRHMRARAMIRACSGVWNRSGHVSGTGGVRA
jgi:hypothetical protein